MFSGHNLMLAMMIGYCIIGVTFLHERNWPKAWYWFSAMQITFSVWLMEN